MSAPVHFTIEEANALIPRLELVMQRIQRAARTVRSALQEHGDEPRAHTTADVLRLRPELTSEVRELERAVEEIEGLGCQFKGLDLGLVDFPADVDGQTVLLCWQYGEKQIAYWHRTDEGFANRRALAAAERPPLQ